MAFHGDLFSFPLPELLQWLDSSRKTGTLQLLWEGGERKLFLSEGQVAATAGTGLWERTARILNLADVSTGERVMEAFGQVRQGRDCAESFAQSGIDLQHVASSAREELYGAVVDLTLSEHGEFRWSEDVDRSNEEWIPLTMSLRALVFEALRWMDEAPEVDRALPSDSVLLRARVAATGEHPLFDRIILQLTAAPRSLGHIRLAMGLSRTAAARRVFDLLRLRLLAVEGAGDVPDDPLARMLENGMELVRQQQFDAASLVFETLLQADPGDRRVREFSRMVQGEHVIALYREMPPLTVFKLSEEPERLLELRPDERHVASLVNGSWDVSTVTLASQRREIDTLKCLQRLWRMGLVRPVQREQ